MTELVEGLSKGRHEGQWAGKPSTPTLLPRTEADAHLVRTTLQIANGRLASSAIQ
jgi:hypothetical protein